VKETEARKPEDTLQEDVIQQTVRVAKILGLQEEGPKIGHTEQPPKDPQEIEGERIGVTE
jgi:hypothetical protein